MKKLLIFGFLLGTFSHCIGQGLTQRRALLEEFTSSSSDSCAQTDFVVDNFEYDAPKNFCIVKWYLPYGTSGGANTLFNDYPLSRTRSEIFYGNLTAPEFFVNGGAHFDPFGLSVDELRAKISPAYSETSTFVLDVSQSVIGDSVIATVNVRSLDTTLDLSLISIGVIITERYKQFTDINHFPYHTNIVRTVLPSLDPKSGVIRDAIPFAMAMQGRTQQTFRFAAKLGGDWDRYGLVSVAVIQNNETKEVLQSNWTLPDVLFIRPETNTFIFDQGITPCQFTLRNITDSDITITPQLQQNAPTQWELKLSGMTLPNFVLPAHTAVTGSFISDVLPPFRGSGDFILLLRIAPGTVLANFSGSLVGNDSRDLIIKNWTSAVYRTDPDITAWQQFGLDAAICNDDALNNLFSNNLNRFRTIYVERSVFGDSSDLDILQNYLSFGGKLIFQSTSVNKLFSASIIDTFTNKYAVNFLNMFHTIPAAPSAVLWNFGNLVPGEVFSDTLATNFTVQPRPIESLVPLDTHRAKPMVIEGHDKNVGVSVRSFAGKIAYLTFPLSDVIQPNYSSKMMSDILAWFFKVEAVNSPAIEESDAHVYPNPMRQNAVIKYDFSSNNKINFALRDELGRIMNAPFQQSDGELHIDCASLQSGAYYYELQSGDKIARGKILVAR